MINRVRKNPLVTEHYTVNRLWHNSTLTIRLAKILSKAYVLDGAVIPVNDSTHHIAVYNVNTAKNLNTAKNTMPKRIFISAPPMPYITPKI